MKKTVILKILQIFFFLLMVTHNIFSVLVNIFDCYPLPNYSIDNHLMIFFNNNFHHDYWGMSWYLVGLVGSFLVINQTYINKWLIYSMIVLTLVCGWWNFKLSVSFF